MSRFKKYLNNSRIILFEDNFFFINYSIKDLYERCIFFDVILTERFNAPLSENALLSIDEEVYEIAGLIENNLNLTIDKIKNILLSSKFKIHFVEKEVKRNEDGISAAIEKYNNKFHIVVYYQKKLVEMLIDNGLISDLAFRIGYVVAHELVHKEQYKSSNMTDDILKKTGTGSINFSEKNAKKKYLKHTREIMAFAQQIYYELQEKYPNKEELLQYFRKDSIKFLKYFSKVGKNYIDTFGDKPENSPVLRRLLRYVYQYIKNGKINNKDK